MPHAWQVVQGAEGSQHTEGPEHFQAGWVETGKADNADDDYEKVNPVPWVP